MLDTIASCTRDEIDTKKLTTFDVDYIFAQIRSKSVGETSTLIFKCRQCEHKNDVVVNIADAKVEGEIANPIVELTPEIKVKMMYPSYHAMTKNDALLNNDDTTSMAFEFIKMCMVSVITDEEQVMLRDETDESVQDFIDSLSSEQFNKMTTFLENVPKMKTEVNFKCESCESDQHATLEGLEDFF
jgi:DNA-directed RNA polymerase subunit M/transcription elongation factor TFIIS